MCDLENIFLFYQRITFDQNEENFWNKKIKWNHSILRRFSLTEIYRKFSPKIIAAGSTTAAILFSYTRWLIHCPSLSNVKIEIWQSYLTSDSGFSPCWAYVDLSNWKITWLNVHSVDLAIAWELISHRISVSGRLIYLMAFKISRLKVFPHLNVGRRKTGLIFHFFHFLLSCRHQVIFCGVEIFILFSHSLLGRRFSRRVNFNIPLTRRKLFTKDYFRLVFSLISSASVFFFLLFLSNRSAEKVLIKLEYKFEKW